MLSIDFSQLTYEKLDSTLIGCGKSGSKQVLKLNSDIEKNINLDIVNYGSAFYIFDMFSYQESNKF
jgi:hypothetical protein